MINQSEKFLCFKGSHHLFRLLVFTLSVLGLSLSISVRNLSSVQRYLGTKSLLGNDDNRTVDEFLNKPINEILFIQREKEHQSDQSEFAVQILTSRIFKHVVCRFNNACVMDNGTIILHPDMYTHRSSISACNVDLQFMKSAADYNKTSFTSKFDLFGFKFPNTHIPHFITDFYPSLIAFNILKGALSERVDNNCTTLHYSEPCTFSELRLAHFLPTKDMHKNNMSTWIPQFYTIFSKDWYFYSRSSWLADGDQIRNRCFKSVIRYHHKSTMLHDLNWFSRTVHGTSTSLNVVRGKNVSPFQRKVLKLNVLLLNRKPGSGRSITNLKDILDVLPKRVNALSISYEISDVYMEDFLFVKQIRMIRQSDLIIGSHGAALTNIIFARPGTPVFEIFPFFYYAPNFRHLSTKFNLQYDYMVAEPDTYSYMRCMRFRLLKFPNMIRIAEQRWESGLALWKKVGKGMVNIPSLPHPYRLDSLSAGKDRMCLRAQQLRVNKTELRIHIPQLVQMAAGN